jgi:hypothetical protein
MDVLDDAAVDEYIDGIAEANLLRSMPPYT